MLMIRTLRQIATSRTIPSFRSASSRSQGDRQRPVDIQRVDYQHHRTQAEEARRQWLQQQWRNRP
ncbi:hypothetical protein [Phormidium tenue]|uniref:Uncharacterized protein n=1 Tax=Phormidium tenue NIES-30 TaxID=549789 RepID=A0A1U7J533_9CYAN|nr:hypothetical protein [Phormidium tenue]MBD2232620.1 hypothetical protein [Phormidium tenue FACHB-1052]OKH47753.1 hypothetical protein NIES30_12265 [Phormidium tenue NIES-30]